MDSPVRQVYLKFIRLSILIHYNKRLYIKPICLGTIGVSMFLKIFKREVRIR